MDSLVELKEVIKIRDVSTIWEMVENMEVPLTISMENVQEFDGAGMQLILHILNLNSAKPDKYIISGLKDPLINKLKNYGYKPGDTKGVEN